MGQERSRKETGKEMKTVREQERSGNEQKMR
jgi:hypothetical protein